MLQTEQRNPNTMHIDQCSTQEILELIQIENRNAAEAVGKAIPQITKACDAIECILSNDVNRAMNDYN